MFVMDVPPDIPPQYAPVVIAQASQAQQVPAKTDRAIGVCQLVENPIGQYPGAEGMNAVGPGGAVRNYLWIFEKQRIDLKSAKISIPKNPEHGIFEERGDMLIYVPKPDYLGPDRATFLVETGGLKVKVEYFIRVMQTVPGGTEGYDPYEDDKDLCPNGHYWKISFNENDPNAPIYTFDHPFQLTNALAGVVNANLTSPTSPAAPWARPRTNLKPGSDHSFL